MHKRESAQRERKVDKTEGVGKDRVRAAEQTQTTKTTLILHFAAYDTRYGTRSASTNF